MGMLFTMQAGWEKLRPSNKTSGDAALDGTTAGLTYAFSDKPAQAKKMGYEANGVQIYFAGTDADNETFDWKLYAYTEFGPAELIAYGTGTLGTAVTGNADEYYADTLTITGQYWYKVVAIMDTTNNRIARLAFDLCGRRYIYVEFSNIGGVGQVASINGYITYY